MSPAINRKLSSLLPCRPRIERVQNDDSIYPLHFLDQNGIVPTLIQSFTFRFNDVLDPQKLHDSLVKLLEIGDWRKLGGRLRLTDNGNMEIHAPPKYTTEHPAIRFSQTNCGVRIEDHPLGSRLPKTSELPSVQEECLTFRSFMVPPNLPNTVEHYLTTDEPLISLLITSFTNATLVSITFPHAILDAVATADFLKAWSSVVADQLDQIPIVLGAKEDPIENVGTLSDENAQTPYVLQNKQVEGLPKLALAIRFGLDVLFRRNVQARTICLPAKFVFQLRQTAEEQLHSNSEKPSFLSDNDLITAWICHKIMSSSTKKRPYIICSLFNLRKRLNKTFIPDASYLQNLILLASVYVPAKEMLNLSFGELALRSRQAIIEQATDTQARSLLRIMKERHKFIGRLPIFGELRIFGNSKSRVIGGTNWSKTGLLEAPNFGPAVISSGQSTSVQPGTCVSYWGSPTCNIDEMRDCFWIYGKDGDGSYWLQAHLRSETWDLIQDEFKRFV